MSRAGPARCRCRSSLSVPSSRPSASLDGGRRGRSSQRAHHDRVPLAPPASSLSLRFRSDQGRRRPAELISRPNTRRQARRRPQPPEPMRLVGASEAGQRASDRALACRDVISRPPAAVCHRQHGQLFNGHELATSAHWRHARVAASRRRQRDRRAQTADATFGTGTRFRLPEPSGRACACRKSRLARIGRRRRRCRCRVLAPRLKY
jgi:hypothetical protein